MNDLCASRVEFYEGSPGWPSFVPDTGERQAPTIGLVRSPQVQLRNGYDLNARPEQPATPCPAGRRHLSNAPLRHDAVPRPMREPVPTQTWHHRQNGRENKIWSPYGNAVRRTFWAIEIHARKLCSSCGPSSSRRHGVRLSTFCRAHRRMHEEPQT